MCVKSLYTFGTLSAHTHFSFHNQKRKKRKKRPKENENLFLDGSWTWAQQKALFHWNLFIHFECTVAAINLWMKRNMPNWLGQRTHANTSSFSHGRLINTIHKQNKKKRYERKKLENLSHMSQQSVFIHPRPSHIVDICAVHSLWIDLPIKSAATNVLNGFKMSFRYVFF